ncbi:Gfo/Idh/MocA family protein [Cellulomonas sp. McL0617]|uniref:Gfo/Idh/MocA family protein n=1 Tax=Cellulomonas sp. McL0617 TaxID=3415675 RepID=UPI003CFADFA3
MLPKAFPTPQLYRPGAGEPALRWGVLAPGWIAHAFANAVNKRTRQRLAAVASRSPERASTFAAEHGIDRVHSSYAALVGDPDIDVVYIAAPQSEHLALGLLAIGAGKHTLIEKPMATNAADARILVRAAQDAGVLLMEAMWSRYLPQAAVIRALVADGVVGEIHAVVADHGQAVPRDPNHRLYRRDLGGGALLDLGIYPIQLDSMVLGAPRQVTAIGGLTDTGVDAYSTIVLTHDGIAQSTLTTSILTRTPTTALIAGSDARIEMAAPFHVPTSLTLAGNELFGETLTWRDETGVALMDGLAWEATALATFVGEGRKESPLHTLDETVSILATIDEARRQLGCADDEVAA